jgi:serine/threonine protein kinase
MSFYPTNDDVPYRHVEHLGEGGYGVVDKVRDSAGELYARKVQVISKFPREVIENEAKIMSKLRHPHIILLKELYRTNRLFCMVMLPVADGNLKELLARADGLDPDRGQAISMLSKMSRCLVQAMDYVHEMGVKHKDIKPANILIKDERPILADFGFSRDLVDADTTASYGVGGPNTPKYKAPEIDLQGGRIGRAADIFSLGCVFLEVATVIRSNEKGELDRFKVQRQKHTNSEVYALCPSVLLQWISMCRRYCTDSSPLFRQLALKEFTHLAFLMLDPNPKTRIRARQLVAMISTASASTPMEHQRISSPCCVDDFRPQSHNMPLHSVFRSLGPRSSPLPSGYKEAGYQLQQVPGNWDEAKGEWLASHIWW